KNGLQAAELYVKIFTGAVAGAQHRQVRIDAADNLLLFLLKTAREAGPELFPVLQPAAENILRLEESGFAFFVNSYYQLTDIVAAMLKNPAGEPLDLAVINRLLEKYLVAVYRCWQQEKDSTAWLKKEIGWTSASTPEKEAVTALVSGISHNTISQMLIKTRQTELRSADARQRCRHLADLPGYGFFVSSYRNLPGALFAAGGDTGQGHRWKLSGLFLILNTPSLSTLHEESLREINTTLTHLISGSDIKRSRELIKRAFLVLRDQTARFPATALNCVRNVGESVYKTGDAELVDFFIDRVISLGFHAPMVEGVDNDWKIKANNAHIQNIRAWLGLIRQNPQRSSRLLSALIIHLTLSGVFIRDTDLFPRDITELLNSDIGPVYNLVKQMTRQLPVFFNDIGAEGALRDISTELDETCHRKDVLVHFLRKQGHVEGSNRLIPFMEAAIRFWRTKDKTLLKDFLPPNMYDQVQTSGEYVDQMHALFTHLADSGVDLPGGLLSLSREETAGLCEKAAGVSDRERRRVALVAEFYKLLDQKYTLNPSDIEGYVARLNTADFPDLKELRRAFAESKAKNKAARLISYLEQLKALILSDERFEIEQNIYEKRHIAVDIPSMYGSYRETKFDALGLTFRLESLLNVLFEEIVASIDLGLITKTTFFQIYNCLTLFVKALAVDGFSTKEIEIQLDLLSQGINTRGFSFTQFLDIFKRFATAVKHIITDHFHNTYGKNILAILSGLPTNMVLAKYLPGDGLQTADIDHDKLAHRVSEVFFREKIALSLGLPQLDLLLTRVLNVLFHQANTLPAERLERLLNYDPARTIAAIDPRETKKYGIIHLGNKGFNIIKLAGYGYPVPPGFIITTEVFRCRDIMDAYPPAEELFRQQMAHHMKHLEKAAGRKFGDPANPLLLAVRSGAAISQPGMMDTALNVGMNEEIAQGLARQTNNAWFAWDSYRRFLQYYGMAFGLKRDDFDAIIREHKARRSIPLKRYFTGDQMREVALDYKRMLADSKIHVKEDPFDQLYVTVKNVFASWYSQKAENYRKIVGISDDWGTAVTVQSMIFGNLSRESGSGVFFTHSPRLPGDTPRLWGDFTIGNQGEDVVSGLVNTLPISIMQKETEQRKTDISLETHFPRIYAALVRWVDELIYEHGWNPQEMEFTFEGPSEDKLFFLQTRDMTIRESKSIHIFDPEDVLESDRFLGQGIGVGGGAMSGRIVFSLEEIAKWAMVEPDTHLILVRGDTVPDDIREISATDGLLTARGGLSSHAAVLAHSMGKTCVVGCGALVCDEKNRTCRFHDVVLNAGDYISLDGAEGSVYSGSLRTRKVEAYL
ncbi:MAG: PEP/pyruvate-binding domain-containing protein, partial [Thermodesulfobacteriota bacterium]